MGTEEIEKKPGFFERVWKFIGKKRNQRTLVFLGAAAAAISTFWLKVLQPEQNTEDVSEAQANSEHITVQDTVTDTSSPDVPSQNKISLLLGNLENEFDILGEDIANNVRRTFVNGDISKGREILLRIEDDISVSNEQIATANYIAGRLSFYKVNYRTAFENFAVAANLQPDNRKYNSWSGTTALYLSQYKASEIYYRKALEVDKQSNTPNKVNIATDHNNIAVSLQKQDEFGEALKHFSESLEIRKSIFPSHSSKLAGSFNNIGMLYKDQAEYKLAMPYLKKALVIYERSAGRRDPKTAAVLLNLGELHLTNSDMELAEPLLKRALAIYEMPSIPNDGFRAAAYLHWGTLMEVKGRSREAHAYYAKASDIYEAIYPSSHPSVALIRSSLARVSQY